MSCGVGRRHGSDPALLWLWCRPPATALIRPLAWERPYAVGAALEMAKRPKKKRKERKVDIQWCKGIILGEICWDSIVDGVNTGLKQHSCTSRPTHIPAQHMYRFPHTKCITERNTKGNRNCMCGILRVKDVGKPLRHQSVVLPRYEYQLSQTKFPMK